MAKKGRLGRKSLNATIAKLSKRLSLVVSETVKVARIEQVRCASDAKTIASLRSQVRQFEADKSRRDYLEGLKLRVITDHEANRRFAQFGMQIMFQPERYIWSFVDRSKPGFDDIGMYIRYASEEIRRRVEEKLIEAVRKIMNDEADKCPI
jgi:hypothetical protein